MIFKKELLTENSLLLLKMIILFVPNIEELFADVRSIHFFSFIRYLYFNIGRMAYMQAMYYQLMFS